MIFRWENLFVLLCRILLANLRFIFNYFLIVYRNVAFTKIMIKIDFLVIELENLLIRACLPSFWKQFLLHIFDPFLFRLSRSNNLMLNILFRRLFFNLRNLIVLWLINVAICNYFFQLSFWNFNVFFHFNILFLIVDFFIIIHLYFSSLINDRFYRTELW